MCWWRRRAGQFWSATARRSGGVGANFFKDSRKKFVLSLRFSDDHFLVIENCNKNKKTATMVSAARGQIIGGGARRSTKVGGCSAHKLSAAARPAHCSRC